MLDEVAQVHQPEHGDPHAGNRSSVPDKTRSGRQHVPSMPLYLTEDDVAALLTPADAVEAIEHALGRIARGSVEDRPRIRIPIEEGEYAAMACADSELGYAGLKTYAWTETGTPFVVLLFAIGPPIAFAAVIEADRLGQLRTGAASAVAARHLARPGAASLGVLGCGRQAASHVACLRAALPGIERVAVYCRERSRLEQFCREHDCDPAESSREAAGSDIVITATTSKDPVLRGEWLAEGALVCAVGANDPALRELDNVVIERAAFVCCDSLEQSQHEAGDLIEPVARGVLDWLEVHELSELVSGELQGRAADSDIVLFKSNGIAAWDLAGGVRVLELAREGGVGTSV
jgi:alanine dehydrogenase